MSGETQATVGAIVTLPDNRSAMVLEVLPAEPEQGIPVRVWLAGDPMNLRREWPEILETCQVQP
jgi:hypothetical protein